MKIKKINKEKYKVESSSRKGKFYKVNIEQPFCDCPNFLFREIKKHGKCKHIIAVEEYLLKKGAKTSSKCKKILDYVKKQKQVDSLKLIEKYSEKEVNELIQKGELIEEKGMIRILS